MSGTLYQENELRVSYYYGGVKKGRMIQIEVINAPHAHLTMQQVKNLVGDLEEWLRWCPE